MGKGRPRDDRWRSHFGGNEVLAPRMHILMKTTSLTGEQMPKIERSGLAAKSKEELIEMILFTSGILDRADKLIAFLLGYAGCAHHG